LTIEWEYFLLSPFSTFKASIMVMLVWIPISLENLTTFLALHFTKTRWWPGNGWFLTLACYTNHDSTIIL